jgi:hypothetical protein
VKIAGVREWVCVERSLERGWFDEEAGFEGGLSAPYEPRTHAFLSASRFSGDAICVLYEPDRALMEGDDDEASAEGDAAPGSESGVYRDLGAMRHAAYRAVSEGLEALCDDYTVRWHNPPFEAFDPGPSFPYSCANP